MRGVERGRGHGYKIKYNRFIIEGNKIFFTRRIMKLWNFLPGAILEREKTITILKIWLNRWMK